LADAVGALDWGNRIAPLALVVGRNREIAPRVTTYACYDYDFPSDGRPVGWVESWWRHDGERVAGWKDSMDATLLRDLARLLRGSLTTVYEVPGLLLRMLCWHLSGINKIRFMYMD
jgi:hypothetical protein